MKFIRCAVTHGKQQLSPNRFAAGASRWPALLLGFVATTLAAPVSAAIAIPDTPLQSGSAVPPNIMFILDDSGSMAWDFMPDSVPSTSPDNIATQTYTRNTVYYNPAITYQPWSNPDGSLFPALPANSAWSDTDLASGGTINLTGSTRRFHVPNNGITDLADARQYTRYELSSGGTSARQCTLNPSNTWVCNNITAFPQWRSAPSCAGSSCTIAEEWQNFANWYSFHRTRMKAAKAGASAAFASLSRDLRVGYRTIWNRSNFDIPVGSNDGLFEDIGSSTNRTIWFNRLYAAEGSGGTPLRNALKGVGDYFSGSGAGGPYGPESGGDQLACRQSFAILTTDGFWNGGSPGVDNQDGTAGTTITGPNSASFTYSPAPPFSDSNGDTLADVAMRYWKSDLRGDLDNIVPTSNADPAFWQHMVTFSLSIGAQGTLNPETDLPAIEAGTLPWPTPSSNSIRNIDDLWHAAVNGHGTFVSADNPQAFSSGLRNALAAIVERTGSASSVATNSVSIGTDTRLFQAKFVAGQWTGDVFAFRISDAGIGSTPLWSASQGIPIPATRRIFTSVDGAGRTFDWTSINATQRSALRDDPAILDYLRGDTSRERRNGGSFRNRQSILGDVVNSSPAFLKESNTIFVGANDGMLHAIDSRDGKELFAYVPGIVNWSDLALLSDPDYPHRWFVDGGIRVSSRDLTSGRNRLVATLGRGGKGLFSLDVTNPSGFSAGNVEWELGGADADMGFILGVPIIAKLNNGDVGVVVGNGINSSSGKASLFIIDVVTGNVIKEINTGVGSATNSNGLSSATGWDSDGNGTIDFVYAGDLQGNVWRFDISGSGTGSWKVAGSPAAPIFTAKDSTNKPQPITAAPTLALNPRTFDRWVFVATGRFLASGDLSDKNPQSVYGFVDLRDGVSGRSELVERRLSAVASASGKTVRAFEPTSDLPAGKKGWYLDLLAPPSATREGERVTSNMFVINGALVFASSIPSDDPCEPGGSGFLNAIDAFSGTTVSNAFFDLNANGDATDDTVSTTGGSVFMGSVGMGIGMLTTPAVLSNVGGFGTSLLSKCNAVLETSGTSGETGDLCADIGGIFGRISWREVIQE